MYSKSSAKQLDSTTCRNKDKNEGGSLKLFKKWTKDNIVQSWMLVEVGKGPKHSCVTYLVTCREVQLIPYPRGSCNPRNTIRWQSRNRNASSWSLGNGVTSSRSPSTALCTSLTAALLSLELRVCTTASNRVWMVMTGGLDGGAMIACRCCSISAAHLFKIWTTSSGIIAWGNGLWKAPLSRESLSTERKSSCIGGGIDAWKMNMIEWTNQLRLTLLSQTTVAL